MGEKHRVREWKPTPRDLDILRRTAGNFPPVQQLVTASFKLWAFFELAILEDT